MISFHLSSQSEKCLSSLFSSFLLDELKVEKNRAHSDPLLSLSFFELGPKESQAVPRDLSVDDWEEWKMM